MSSFKKEDFLFACEELNRPDLAGWELYSKTRYLQIYRLYVPDTGLYQYKVIAELNVDPYICSAVYKDIQYRKIWDPHAKDIKVIGKGNESAIYWLLKLPYPFWDRDYVYEREMRELELVGITYYVSLQRNVTLLSGTAPEREGIVRAKQYQQMSALRTNLQGGTRAYMKYYDNPGGMVPAFLINWVEAKTIPTFLHGLVNACYNYPEYLTALGDRRKKYDLC